MGRARAGTSVDGARLWYEAAGEGAAVVLLHAGVADARMWDGHFEALAEDYRVVRLKLRGYPDHVSALVLVASALGGHARSSELDRLDAEEDRLLGAGDLDGAVELDLRAWVDGPRREPGAVAAGARARIGEMQRRAFETILAA